MPFKAFESIQGDDPMLRQRYLDDNAGMPPDYFVESAEGGGINNAELAPVRLEEEQRLIQGLENRLRRLRPGIIGDNEEFRS